MTCGISASTSHFTPARSTAPRISRVIGGFLQLAVHEINALGAPFLGTNLSLNILKKRREAANGGLEVVTGQGVMTVVLPDLATAITRFAGAGGAREAAGHGMEIAFLSRQAR